MASRRSLQLVLDLIAIASLVAAGPCDLYASGNTPCVAAHSSTRALYSAYNGPLYRIQRSSDGDTADVSTLSAGGIANAAGQDSFCDGTTCVITIIYDQSGNENNLTTPAQGYSLADATAAPVTLNGQRAYGIYITPGTGYRNDATTGVATGDEAEGMYAVLDGTHYNNNCCFDYGNAETDNQNDGNGHMEAIYFGNNTIWGSGSGSGPWIMADMENGLFSGYSPTVNTADLSISWRFVTATLKGGPDEWEIKGADATSGSLSTYNSGVRPDEDGYNPMSKEGAIILGIGGDDSDGAQGTFYEGVMTTGYPSDDTENSVQADIVAAGYAAA